MQHSNDISLYTVQPNTGLLWHTISFLIGRGGDSGDEMMNARVNIRWLTLSILLVPLHTVFGQGQLKALVTGVTPIAAITVTTPAGGESPIGYPSTFRKDPFITIKEDAGDPHTGLEDKIFSVKSVWELFDSDTSIKEDAETLKKQTVVEVFLNSFNEELHEDPFYHVGRDVRADMFIYDEQAWDALGDTLRKKYRIVETIHHTAARAEEVVTLKYETDSQTKFRGRPGIERIGNKEYIIFRVGIRMPRARSNIDTRVSERGYRLRMGRALGKTSPASTVSLEHEYSKSDAEETQGEWEQISQVTVRVPIW
jgi:hypothetical protein